MTIESLLARARQIWGPPKDRIYIGLDVIIPMGVIFGDICRWQRGPVDLNAPDVDAELKKELGNMIFSTIRWCDDLGFDIEECIQLAIPCQERYVERLREIQARNRLAEEEIPPGGKLQ